MKIISAVFHPLLMATYCATWLYFVFPEIFSPIPAENVHYFILMLFLTTGLIPGLSVLMLKFSHRISSLDILDKKERQLPFVSIAIFYLISTYLFKAKINISYHLFLMMLIVSLLIVLIIVITLRYKISVHAAAIWGVTGLMVAIAMRFPISHAVLALSIVVISAGITSSSRLYLNRHESHEVWTGAILGFFFCFFGFYLFS